MKKTFEEIIGRDSVKQLNNERYDCSRISGKIALPNLVEIQTKSYQEFINTGLDEVFREVFPIVSVSGDIRIEFVGIKTSEISNSYLECKATDKTYSRKLEAHLRLFKQDQSIDDKETVYMGDLPVMTSSGTFIVNGAERVIVSQIVRSPGAYMSKSRDLKTGVFVYGADLIPGRGTWVQYEREVKGNYSVHLDRNKKMKGAVILRAIGLSDDAIYQLFADKPVKKSTLPSDVTLHLLNMLEYKLDSNKSYDAILGDLGNAEDRCEKALIEIFQKLKPGEPVTAEGRMHLINQRFFDDKRSDLGRAGRYKFAKKLGIYNRLVGVTLAENLIDENGEIVFASGTKLTEGDVDSLQAMEYFEHGNCVNHVNLKKIMVDPNCSDIKAEVPVFFNCVKVYTGSNNEYVTNIIGTDLTSDASCSTLSDFIALFSYFVNIQNNIGKVDDIDHLSNRRIRSVGELIQNQFRMGLGKMAKAIQQKMTVTGEGEDFNFRKLINIKPLTSSIREFFASSQLSQFMDQTNPLAELTNKRRISALGPGGLTRDRASTEVRDVHFSHYGRICPIETPEGQNIGLINNLCTYAKVNNYGFIETPYRRVDKKNHIVLDGEDNTDYLDASEEFDYVIAEANINLGENGEILDENVVARYKGENIIAKRDDVDYVDVSPKQIVSIAAACIPFLENDDTTRALMGANMQRQALPLLNPHAPFVGTGLEHQIARDSGLAVVAVEDGTVVYSDSRTIKIQEEGKSTPRSYQLLKFERSNQATCINQKSIVKVGDKVKAGDIIADGPAMQNGDLALGQNVTIAFMTWNGYNYEDAVIMNEKLVKRDTYTTIHIENYDIDCRETKIGPEIITRDIPNVDEGKKTYLDERGIIIPGAIVKDRDILVGKVTPRGLTEPTPEEKILMAIFSEKAKEGKDASLRVPHGCGGIVLAVKSFKRSEGADLPKGVEERVRVYIVQKRKISEGDKMSGRHGNKGVISKILPEEDMPFLPDGTPIDVMLNPLGVPSRMNIGQILEVHLGYALKKLGFKIATPVFDGITNDEIQKLMAEAGMDKDGKTVLYDGQTGDRFDERITVGVMYMIKLVHMVDDKLHARATGPYSLVTQQPLGGKAQNGGQRFGEMEVWALEAYGAAHILQEMLTIKSDDRIGRKRAYDNITRNNPVPKSGIPEAFKVLVKELKGLSLNVQLYDTRGETIDLDELARKDSQEEKAINRSLFAKADDKVAGDEEIDDIEEESVADDEEVSFTEISEHPID